MTCYVDDVSHAFGRMKMCHLWADTEEELLAMVDKIGVQRKWIQGHKTLSFGKHRDASWVHFDISITKKKAAIHHGAVLTDQYGPVVHTANLKLAWALANGNETVAHNARAQLAQIALIRIRRLPQGVLDLCQ